MALAPDHLFRLLADPTRLRCLLLLRRQGRLCVCELTAALAIVQPKISRHLALLREAGLVEHERRGQWVHYRITPEQPAWVGAVLDAALASGEGQAWYEEDLARLSEMPNSTAKEDG